MLCDRHTAGDNLIEVYLAMDSYEDGRYKDGGDRGDKDRK